MTQYRSHRGGLSDSMATARSITTAADIAAIEDWIVRDGYDASDITVAPYGFDNRIGWDTHIVTIPGYGVLGFTDGPLV